MPQRSAQWLGISGWIRLAPMRHLIIRRTGCLWRVIPLNWQPFLDEIITHPAPDDFRAPIIFASRSTYRFSDNLVRHLPDQRTGGSTKFRCREPAPLDWSQWPLLHL